MNKFMNRWIIITGAVYSCKNSIRICKSDWYLQQSINQ